MTEFCGVDVPIDGKGLTLFVDGNSKITRSNGSYERPTPNALSLPHVSSCPGATPACAGSCYVHGLRAAQPELWAKYQQNFETLGGLLGTSPLGLHTQQTFGQWIREHCPGGFRWHVSGDLFSEAYARWVTYVSLYAEVPCWLYTRSFKHLAWTLACPPNLTINLSADRDNYAEAREKHLETGYRICYLVDASGHVPGDLPEGSVLFPDYVLRGRGLEKPTTAPWWRGLTHRQRLMVCPADFFGQSERRRCGPCGKCLG